jgi:ribokinase
VDRAAEAIAAAAVLLLQLETPLETVIHAAACAAASGTRVLLNPAPAQPLPAELLQHVSILTPNETEAQWLTGEERNRVPGREPDGLEGRNCVPGREPAAGREESTALAAAQKLRQQGVETVIVTLGARGALLVTGEGSEVVPAPKVQPVDTTAAGDAFNGALAVALGEGKGLREAVRFANAAGALATTKLGAQPSLPRREEIEKLGN